MENQTIQLALTCIATGFAGWAAFNASRARAAAKVAIAQFDFLRDDALRRRMMAYEARKRMIMQLPDLTNTALKAYEKAEAPEQLKQHLKAISDYLVGYSLKAPEFPEATEKAIFACMQHHDVVLKLLAANVADIENKRPLSHGMAALKQALDHAGNQLDTCRPLIDDDFSRLHHRILQYNKD